LVIAAIDQALERLLREHVPLPADIADISFEPPDGTWGAALSRITVNLYLFDVNRSPQPSRPPAERLRDDGRVERRPPLPLVRLYYMVTAWAGSTRDEHQLLGDLITCILGQETLPPEYLSVVLPSPAQLSLAQRDGRRPGELWGGLHGSLRPSFELEVTVALDAAWKLAPTQVATIEGKVDRQPEQPVKAESRRSNYGRSVNGEPAPLTRRRTSSGVVLEGPPAQGPGS
jgi:hypothetical protein